MTEPEYAALCDYIRWCADEMGLRDWTIVISRHAAPENTSAIATCEPIDGRRVATIQFRQGFRERAPEDQRETVVHELLHCHLFRIVDPVRLDLFESRALSHAHYETLANLMKREVEFATDAIASSIAKHFPLIQWPELERHAR